MDVRIKDGDVFLTAAGGTEYLSAAREAAQRALIAASTVKGTFIYDRSLGADYASLDGADLLKKRLDMLIREATAGIADAEVSVTSADAVHKTATMTVSCRGTTITTEVDLHGIL